MVRNISPYGLEIKKKLLEMGQTQNWLIERVREKTNLYFDTSYLHKILTGAEETPTIVRAINEILGFVATES